MKKYSLVPVLKKCRRESRAQVLMAPQSCEVQLIERRQKQERTIAMAMLIHLRPTYSDGGSDTLDEQNQLQRLREAYDNDRLNDGYQEQATKTVSHYYGSCCSNSNSRIMCPSR